MQLTLINKLLENKSIADLRSVNTEELFENLGNLAIIDKGLLKAMRTKIYRYDQARRSDDGGDRLSPKEVLSLRPGIGRESQVQVTTVVPPVGTLLSKFMSDQEQVALVVKVNEKQVLAVVNRARLENVSGEERLAIIANENLFQDLLQRGEFDQALGAGTASVMGKGNWKDTYKGEANLIAMLDDEKTPYVRKVLKLILDKAKEKKLEVVLMYITRDLDAKEKQGVRALAKQGAVVLPSSKHLVKAGRHATKAEYEVFVDKLKSDLTSRLNSYKNNKLKNIGDTVEDLLKAMLDAGIVDKIKFMGAAYDLSSSSIHLDSLKKPDRWSTSYIEYTQKGGDRWGVIHDFRKELRTDPDYLKMKETSSENALSAWEDEKLDEFRKTQPPQRFKVILALEKGKIVPSKIQTDDSY